jgi:Flp pilus assembly protein TadB
VAAVTGGDPDEGELMPRAENLRWVKPGRNAKRPDTVLSSRSDLMQQLLQKEAEEAAAQAPADEPEPVKKKKKRKKKGSGYFDPKETLQLVAGVGALVAVLAFLAWGYPGIRFPLGGILCVIGFIVYLLGSASLRQVVAEDGFFKLLLFRFCPPYQWWYVMTHWEETRDFFAFFVAGACIMGVGGAIIKTSEEGRRAEASDRAFQKLQRGRSAQTVPPVFRLPDRDEE